MKIYYFGKRITGWAEFKHKAKKMLTKLFKLTVAFAFLAGAIFGAYKTGEKQVPLIYAQPETVEVDNLTPKVEELKSELLADLRSCESQGRTEDDGLIVFDTNSVASIGTLQYQVKTVQHYYKTLYGEDITRKEAILTALDDEKAGELALKIMFESGNKANDWLNCARKHNLNARIDLIKQLEK